MRKTTNPRCFRRNVPVLSAGLMALGVEHARAGWESLEYNLHWTVSLWLLTLGLIALTGLALVRMWSARVRAQEKLAESESWFRHVYENAPVMMHSINREGRYCNVNAKWQEETGYSRDEVLGQRVDFLMTPESAQRVWGMMADYWRVGQVRDIALKFVRKDGTMMDVLVDSNATLDAHGQPISLAVARNVTANKLAEEALRESEQRFAEMFNESPMPLALTRMADGRFVEANKSFKELFGYSTDELLGHTTRELGFYEDSVERDALLGKIETGRGVHNHEIVLLDRQRHRLEISMSMVVIRIGTEQYLVTTLVDMTEHKRMEAELNRALQAAEASSVAKSQFLANMSHEIRTPLNSVIGTTELLLETTLTGEQQVFAEMARRSGEALLKVINDILDFSKIEAGRLELETVPFNLPGVVADAAGILELQARAKGLELACRIEPDVTAEVLGDPGRLRQVLINLIGNAVKFTERGQVLIRVERTQDEERQAGLKFTIRDTGIGIPEERRDCLFQSFSQVDSSLTRRYGGTGLGLAICRRLVELMGGRIGVDSRVGEGSAFWFTLAFKKPPCAGGTVAPAPARGEAGGRPAEPARAVGEIKILLAEDNWDNQMIVAHILKRIGLPVDVVGNGHEAVAALERTAYDLVLMDIQMPGMDGLEATRMIRQKERGGQRHTRIIAMTAHAMGGDRERGLAAGMDGYLTKPLDPAALIAVVRASAATDETSAAAGNGSESSMGRPGELAAVGGARSERELQFVPHGNTRAEARTPNSPNPEAPPGARGFDPAALLHRLDGDRDVFRSILAVYLEGGGQHLAALQAAWDAQDAAGVKFHAHALKGSSANIGAEEMRRLAQAAEAMGAGGTLAPGSPLKAELAREFGSLRKALETSAECGVRGEE